MTLEEHALDLLAANRYLVLGTVGSGGGPWTTPVYFAADGLREVFWMSESSARHSHHLARDPRVSIAVFDSSVAPYHGRAVYAVGEGHVVPAAGLDHALSVYPGAAERGGSGVSVPDVTDPSPYRLYRASLDEVWVLCPREPGRPCALHGEARDHRARVR